MNYVNYSHNPYFNRWFSAMMKKKNFVTSVRVVTILILIDGFLQLRIEYEKRLFWEGHNPYFNRWFSAIT